MKMRKQMHEALKQFFAICWLLKNRSSLKTGYFDRNTASYTQIAMNNLRVILNDLLRVPETLGEYIRRMSNT